MAELYERITGQEPERVGPKIPGEFLVSVVQEVQATTMTQAQGLEILRAVSSSDGDPKGPLSAVQQQEVQDLVNTIPGGGTAANVGGRAQRINEIRRIMQLAEQTVPLGLAPLATPADVRTRLGVPTR